jgi:hypothetical protein
MKLKLAASVFVLGLATLLGACQTGGDTTLPEDPAADPNAPAPEETMPESDPMAPEGGADPNAPAPEGALPESDPTAPEGSADPMAPEGQEPQANPEG